MNKQLKNDLSDLQAQYLPSGCSDPWPPSYIGYDVMAELMGKVPMSEADFNTHQWLTRKHYQSWLFVEGEIDGYRLQLELYNRIDSLNVSLDAQRKLFSKPIDGHDLSHVTLDDGIDVDEFVDFVAQIVKTLNTPLEAA